MKKYSVEYFASSKRLASLPEVSLKLVRLAQQSDPDFDEAARLISGDPALSGKILQTVNSPLFGLRAPIESVREALPMIGINMMRTHALGFHLRKDSSANGKIGTLIRDVWRNSVSQAVISQLISDKAKIGRSSVYFHIGMLQDVGILAMLCEATDYYVENVLAHAELSRIAAAERSCFGFSHVDVSVAIAKRWGFSETALNAIRHHHDDSLLGRRSPRANEVDARILYAANLGSVVLNAKRSSTYSVAQFHEYLQAGFDFTSEQCAEIVVEGAERLAEFVGVFNINADKSVANDLILHEANQLLQKIAIDAQLQLLGRNIEPINSIQSRDIEVFTDPLTGAYNRRFLDDTLQRRLNDRRETIRTVGVLFLDVDEFKTINDSFGHSVGDKAITHVAESLMASVRNDDYVIRLGGDEFLVLVIDTGVSEFESLAERIQHSIQPMQIEGKTHSITVSSGGVFYEPSELKELFDVWEVIEQADQLMYDSKRSGGGRCTLARFADEQDALDPDHENKLAVHDHRDLCRRVTQNLETTMQ